MSASVPSLTGFSEAVPKASAAAKARSSTTTPAWSRAGRSAAILSACPEMVVQCLKIAFLAGEGREAHAPGSRRDETYTLPGSAAASRSSSKSVGSKPSAPSGVVGPGSWSARVPDGEQGSAAERSARLWGEDPYVLNPLVDPTGLDAASRDASSRDMLWRGRTKNIGAKEDTGSGGRRDLVGLRVTGHKSSRGTATPCTSATCTAVVKVWRAMRRALRALGSRASAPESVATEGRSSARSPLSVRVLTGRVVGLFTSPVVKGLSKASSPLTY